MIMTVIIDVHISYTVIHHEYESIHMNINIMKYNYLSRFLALSLSLSLALCVCVCHSLLHVAHDTCIYRLFLSFIRSSDSTSLGAEMSQLSTSDPPGSKELPAAARVRSGENPITLLRRVRAFSVPMGEVADTIWLFNIAMENPL